MDYKNNFVIFLLFLNCAGAHGYETVTHNSLSLDAIDISVLNQDPRLFQELSLEGNLAKPLLPSVVPEDPDGSDPDDEIFLQRASIERIISGGAVLEDASTRSVHHFFDPQNGGVGGAVGLPSSVWILESLQTSNVIAGDDFSLPNQYFSYRDALEFFYLGLTSVDEQSRLVNFGLMFRSLGHVIHHLQDMAQPQHVRSDQHCNALTDFPSFAFFCFITGNHNPSYYEKYTASRVNAGLGFPAGTSIDVPMFAAAREYWENPNKSGIAEYTSHNFVSDGTNYRGDEAGELSSLPSFPEPVPLANVVTVSLEDLLVEDTQMLEGQKQSLLQRLGCNNNPCLLDFIQNEVAGTNTGLTINPRSSTLSIFDAELRVRNLQLTNNFLSTYITKRVTSLNRFNFESAYPYLLPRAVAYSTGMINHFFRGRLEIIDTEFIEDEDVRITIQNNSTPGNIFKNGTFEIYYDALSGERKSLLPVSTEGTDTSIATGDTMSIRISPPDDVDTDINKPYILVFNGMGGVVGEEAGIAAITFHIASPGIVDRLSSNFSACPDKVYAVYINFDEQPANAGQVILQGGTSGALFDFQSVPENTPVFQSGRRLTHGIDEETGRYFYEMTYRHPDSGINPCNALPLGPWLQGEKVIARAVTEPGQ